MTWTNVTLPPAKPFPLSAGQTQHIRMQLHLPAAAAARDGLAVGVEVLGGRVRAMLRSWGGVWVVDVPGVTSTESHSNLVVRSGGVSLDVYVDRFVVEIFASDCAGRGAVAVTCTVAPLNTTEDAVNLLAINSTFVIAQIDVWQMGAACPWSQ